MGDNERHGARTYRAAPNLAWRAIDDDVFVYQPGNRLHVLEGPVSQRLWSLLDSAPRTEAELAAEICREFAVEEAEAHRDIQSFISSLVKLGIIQAEIP